MALSWREARDEGIRKADAILRFFGVYSPAVPVYEIATSLGAVVQEVIQPGWTGAVQVVNDVPYIWVDANHSARRKRFTVAHEIGHLLLHPLPLLENGQFRDNASFTGGLREIEANVFAADLLVPLWMLTEYGEKFNYSSRVLARMFEVSEQVINIRFQKMILGK